MTTATATDAPAILGGRPIVSLDPSAANRWPVITDEDVAAVTAVLRSGELSLHRVTQDLEGDYRAFLGTRHALAYCNGTSAIQAALHAFDLQPGDEVIVPSATYWASVMPVLWSGAVPVFCESELDQQGLDPEDVAKRISPRTKAMVIVHLWGMPSKLDALLDVARRANLRVLEDASHAQGAKYRGKLVGTFGDAAVFSLQTTKLAPAGEGGILVTDDDAIHERVVCLGHYERIPTLTTTAKRFAGTGFGLKHRMAPLSAAIARTQLRRLAERNARRNENIVYVSRHLERLGFRTFLPTPQLDRVYFQFMILNDETQTGLETQRLAAALRAEGCDVAYPRYPLLHQQPVFSEDRFIDIARLRHVPREQLPTYRTDALPRTVAANRRLLQLPSFPNADRDLLDQYVAAFEKVVAGAPAIMAAPLDLTRVDLRPRSMV